MFSSIDLEILRILNNTLPKETSTNDLTLWYGLRAAQFAIIGGSILTVICILLIIHQIKLRKEIRKLRELIENKGE